MPGVLTPLNWSMWAAAIERAPLEAARRIGALTRAEASVAPEVDDRATRIFFGRPAIQVESFALLGDRMPGTTGPETVRSVFGRVPEDITFAPTRTRYPHIAARLPWVFATTPRQLRRFAADQDRWYHHALTGADRLDQAGAARLLTEARRRQEQALVAQVTGIFGLIQPLYGALVQLAERHNFDDINTLTAFGGGAETHLVTDIWSASRGRLTLAEVQRRHGFHGPAEGEISSRVWRLNPAPLQRLIDEYATRDDTADPAAQQQCHNATRREVEARFLAALPRPQRPLARLLLRLAADRIPLRGVVKRSFLQALDVGRAAAHRLGQLHHQAGNLSDPDDVFHLTVEELTGNLPDNLPTLIADRTRRREAYQQLAPLSEWTGQPNPVTAQPLDTDGPVDGDTIVEGVGVSSGVVEGPARVVTSPDDEDIESDEILIAPFTDPSWSSLLFLSAGLVVDIGGALSHAAVVAREMGVPCVVNTRTGTHQIRTGDHVRVDGTNGTVHILRRGDESA
jgi:pyruvate,water dikinase